MALKRIVFLVLVGVTLIIAAVCHLVMKSMGFPDGHLTELDRARRVLYSVVMLVSIIVAAAFFYFSVIFQRCHSLRFPVILFTCYAVLLATSFLTNHVFTGVLDHGKGG